MFLWLKKMLKQTVAWFRPNEGEIAHVQLPPRVPLLAPIAEPVTYVESIPAPSPVPPEPQPEPEAEQPEPQIEEAEQTEEAGRRKHKPHKPHDFTYHLLRRDLADEVMRMLDRFERLSISKSDDPYYDMPVLPSLWHEDYLLINKELVERMKGGDRWSAVDDASLRELAEAVWPVSIGAMYHNNIYEGASLLPAINLVRMETVTARDVRGKVQRVVPKMVRLVSGTFADNGHWIASDCYLGLIGDEWRPMKDYEVVPRIHADWAKYLMTAALTARYEWHVALGTIPDGPRILLPTNPAGCLKLFSNRDRPPGKDRREQLRHWVEEHYRDTGVDLAFVCAHLRGNTVFGWNGFGCELFVSEYDLEMNDYFKKQAGDWRARRKHNVGARVRIRRRSK